jgi:uracil-DNA glycosylase family 4
MADPTQSILAATLEWTLAMGVDAVVADAAVDWLAADAGAPGRDFEFVAASEVVAGANGLDAGKLETHATPVRSAQPVAGPDASQLKPARPASPPAPVRKFTPSVPDMAIAAAKAAAREATNLEDLQRSLTTFEGCSLKATAKSLCFYRGAAQAPLMVIGDTPGRAADIEGRPFVGPAGNLLDRILAAAGWMESDVHIASLIYWRPPGNRPPTQLELDICRPFLERQIELVSPRALLILGQAAAKHILRTDEPILKIRGCWQTLAIGDLNVPVIASLHPTYLARTPIAKRQVWLDILSVREVLKGRSS